MYAPHRKLVVCGRLAGENWYESTRVGLSGCNSFSRGRLPPSPTLGVLAVGLFWRRLLRIKPHVSRLRNDILDMTAILCNNIIIIVPCSVFNNLIRWQVKWYDDYSFIVVGIYMYIIHIGIHNIIEIKSTFEILESRWRHTFNRLNENCFPLRFYFIPTAIHLLHKNGKLRAILFSSFASLLLLVNNITY